MKTCPKCQFPNSDDAKFCMYCGTNLNGDAAEKTKRKKNKVFEKLNDYMGNDQPADLNWKVLFTDVLKKHTLDDAEEIFIAGTKTTTPKPQDITTTWPHPWLYGRVLTAFLLSFGILLCAVFAFGNLISLPGVMLLGSFAIPVTTVVLFMEMNVFRDVSFYEITKFFLIGGCASILFTLILDSSVGVDGLDISGAILTGIVEEVAKLLMVFFFIRNTPYRSILAGLLIGAAVGAGFAAFESAGYALGMLVDGDGEDMLTVIILRALLAPGGHVAWAAITGAALMIAANHGKITGKLLFKPEFLRLFIIPIVLHAIWDMPWCQFIGYTILLVLVWVIVMILFNMGLNEAKRISDEANNNP